MDAERWRRYCDLSTARNLALEKHGSQSIEYRRAYRRAYRSGQRRIDYQPDRESVEILETALREGYAPSFSNAINQALLAWRDTFPELNKTE